MRYFNAWSCVEDIIRDFNISYKAIKDEEVILADYNHEDYEGHAIVVYRRGGKLYEVNGSHCSCYGLSEAGLDGGASQWEPEETSKAALLMRDGWSPEQLELLKALDDKA